jgi:hypothetical protein
VNSKLTVINCLALKERSLLSYAMFMFYSVMIITGTLQLTTCHGESCLAAKQVSFEGQVFGGRAAREGFLPGSKSLSSLSMFWVR